MSNVDEALVADLFVEYYNRRTNNNGISSDELLSRPLTAAQRRLLLDRMDDVNIVLSLTTPLHEEAGTRHPRMG
jgi:hypothetical protein